MKNIKMFLIPDGALGLLYVLPDCKIYTMDFYTSNNWLEARYIRHNLIEVRQILFDEPTLIVKDIINTWMIFSGYYAFLQRPNGYFGIAKSDKPFLSSKQKMIQIL